MAEEESGDRYSVKTDENQDDERAFWDRFFESLKPVKQEIDNAKKAISSSFIGESIDTVAQLVDDAGDARCSNAQDSRVNLFIDTEKSCSRGNFADFTYRYDW